MSLEINLVNLGSYPNDGSGDDLRTAFEKTNANFTSINENVVVAVENLGNGAPLVLDKVDNSLKFRSIKSGNENLSISYDSQGITLAVNNLSTTVEFDTTPKLGGNLNLNGFEINGVGDIDISGAILAENFEGTFLGDFIGNFLGNVFGDVTGNVNGQVSDISNHFLRNLSDVSSATPEIGDALAWDGNHWAPSASVSTNLSNLGDVQLNSPKTGQVLQYNGNFWTNEGLFDFGLLSGIRNQFDLIFQFTPVDFGSINNPSNVTYDLGVITDAITYILSANSTTVSEGNIVVITLNTTNIANGTLVPYAITGVSSSDINGSSLTGSFVIINNTASLALPITVDSLVENETLTLTLQGITPEVSVSVTINDVFPLEDAVVNGGAPADISTAILDGEGPTSAVTVLLDGGLIV